MKKGLRFIMILMFIYNSIIAQNSNQIDKIFRLKIEQSQISRGDNFPDFRVKKDSADIFLFLLHKGYTPKEFQSKTNFSNEKMSDIISHLESKNWLHEIDSLYKPTIFIADEKDGEALFNYAKPISQEITLTITQHITKIKKQFSETGISKTQNFQTWSFLVLSDVLLDSWQINNVEKEFLKQSDRPLRNGKNYYYFISENTNPEIESFGIYGNQILKDGTKYICIYGNNRKNINIKASNNIISKADNKIFETMAKDYFPELLKILEKNRNYSLDVYSKLGYDKEISFEEFFIWWYHFIYTQSTNEMNEKGILTIPQNGNFDYISE